MKTRDLDIEDNILFNNLKDIREINNLKQKDLASLLGVSRPNYTRWETRVNIIPLEKLNTLCNYFEVDMNYAVGINRNYKKMGKDNILDKKLIGENIKKFRHKYNLTQDALASILHTTHSTISSYEHGKTLILTAFLIQIAIKYNESMDAICGRI